LPTNGSGADLPPASAARYAPLRPRPAGRQNILNTRTGWEDEAPWEARLTSAPTTPSRRMPRRSARRSPAASTATCASSGPGAQAIYGVAAGQAKLERLIGASGARAVWEVSIEGLALIRELIARYSIQCDWTPGHLAVAVKERHVRELEAELHELRERYGYPSVSYMPREELRATLATERYLGGLYDTNSGHLHPLNYTLGLAAAAEGLGVRVVEGTRAAGFAANGSQVRVRTAAGEVRARYLALCGNVYLGPTAPPLAWKIMAVATYIVATEPLGA